MVIYVHQILNQGSLDSKTEEKNPGLKEGFFQSELHSKNCIFAGANGTYTVCTYSVHQNIKLMVTVFHYKDCSNAHVCLEPSAGLYFNKCQERPEIAPLANHLQEVFNENGIGTVTYCKWLTTDRCHLQTVAEQQEIFVESFAEKLQVLVHHSFIAMQLSSFLKHVKENIQKNTSVVILDFSGNYSFILQDEVQNSQTGRIDHISFSVISDRLVHDACCALVSKETDFFQVTKWKKP
ncbi:hypothetical protein PR048_001510 [Dryococelus australis]|uniref:Uncharacterized protein n=1 Tax=Dryococelus australis TaxID=614101 RepID=A0ABQ9II98_9NEOP|nr:hypothetical protein PR048_001510 [Dryococelus australis]